MYLPGRLRTASRPSRAVMEAALYSVFCLDVSTPDRFLRRSRPAGVGAPRSCIRRFTSTPAPLALSTTPNDRHRRTTILVGIMVPPARMRDTPRHPVDRPQIVGADQNAAEPTPTTRGRVGGAGRGRGLVQAPRRSPPHRGSREVHSVSYRFARGAPTAIQGTVGAP